MGPTVDCRELFLKLGDDDVLVLDCRAEDGWDMIQCCIPGALRISLEELADAAESLPDDELIVLCGAAEDRSDVLQACELLRAHGRDPVVLAGGLREWIASGLPVERLGPRGFAPQYGAAEAHA